MNWHALTAGTGTDNKNPTSSDYSIHRSQACAYICPYTCHTNIQVIHEPIQTAKLQSMKQCMGHLITVSILAYVVNDRFIGRPRWIIVIFQRWIVRIRITGVKFPIRNSALSNEIMEGHTSNNILDCLSSGNLGMFSKILNFIFRTPKERSMTFLTLACAWLKVSFITRGGGLFCHCSTWYLVHLYGDRQPGRFGYPASTT